MTLTLLIVLGVVLVLDSPLRRGLLLLAAASLALADVPAAEERLRSEPLLIAKGEDYLVHGVLYPLHDDPARFRARPWGGCAVLHTKPSTGEMKCLVSTRTVEVPTRRISFHQTRLIGLACDAKRLYALVWSSGRVYDDPPDPGRQFKGGSYSLHVFWLADGTSLGETWLRRDPGKSPISRPNAVAVELPDLVAQETFEKGPLKLIEKGVACYGVDFEFEGRKLTGRRPSAAADWGVEGVGKVVAYKGVARNGKLGACVEARKAKPMAVFLDDRRQWDPSLLGKQVTVKGILRVRMIGTDDGKTQALRQPVFYMTEYSLEVEGAPAPKP